jgi:hypothetical protein
MSAAAGAGSAGSPSKFKLSEHLTDEEFEVLQNDAAVKISSVFKLAFARRVAARMGARVYQRFFEPSWSAEYYFNPRTKQSFWDKPKMLHDVDVPFADEVSAALAASAGVGVPATTAPLSSMLGGEAYPLTREQKLEAMRLKNKKGACDAAFL